MADRNLKVVDAPESKAAPEAKSAPDAKAEAPAKSAKRGKKRLRALLLVALPALALVIGLGVYLLGGRYISTDNAYIGAQKVLITPDVSGKVISVSVREGERVSAGQELFALDPQPFQLQLDAAQAKLAAARTDYANLKSNLKSLETLADLAQKNVDIKRRDVERKQALVRTQAGSAADVDTAAAALVTAQLQAQYAKQQRDTTINQLLGDPDLPLEKFPAYAQAKAAAEQAQRDLDHATLRAPISGIATQVDNIQLGRFVTAAAPVFSIIDDSAPWVDANPKETDITYLRVGQKVTIDVDTFPDHTFTGTVAAVSPGTGAQFSILPPQNATGNWIKVVQRVPVRIVFDKNQDTRFLRSGMSVTVDIDTGHSRLPFMSAKAAEPSR
jgi:membrane fusion protein (multidrug efflux system)